jgi:N-acyl-D-aspartate/D-glutamate deacylase
MADIVIRDAFVVDGTGTPGIHADVAIDGGVITEVGDVAATGRREVRAEGRVLAPGWVDIHTHYDGQATWDPELTPSSWHGVTTAVMGNCGVGFAPVRRGSEEFLIELMALSDAGGAAGHGVYKLVSDRQGVGEEAGWLAEIARRTGGTVTFSLSQTRIDPNAFRDALAASEAAAAEGLDIVPQVACRPVGMLFGLRSSLHPFIAHPWWRAAESWTHEQRVAALSRPEVRAELLAQEPVVDNPVALLLMSQWQQMFDLGEHPDYEPTPESSVASRAEREGRRPEEVALDLLLARGGEALLFAPLAGYEDRDHEAIREMMTHPRSVLGLGDGGAHCGLICDGSMPTYLLTHWVRDRTRGPRWSIEAAVHRQTGRAAATYGLSDRGTIESGERADLNLIDLDGLTLHAPEMVFDLPANGRRLIQRADGYRATIVAGTVTFEDGEPTGARPGRLVRGTAR